MLMTADEIALRRSDHTRQSKLLASLASRGRVKRSTADVSPGQTVQSRWNQATCSDGHGSMLSRATFRSEIQERKKDPF